MDTRDLSILIGQALNLAHAEFLKIPSQTNFDSDAWIKHRTKDILKLSLDIRAEVKKDLEQSKESKIVRRIVE